MDTQQKLIKAALTEDALDELLAWMNSWLESHPHLGGPDFWGQSPDAMEILRDIFRGYVVGNPDCDTEFGDDPDIEWSEVGLEADMLLVNALIEIDKNRLTVEIFCTQIDCQWGYAAPDEDAANDALESHLREAHA